MKQYLTTVLALALIVLVISLVIVKRGDNAQHDADTGSINDFSNQLSLAQTEISINEGTIAVQSNNLVQWQSSALTFSNNLTEAETTNILDLEQITNLTGQIAEGKSENQTLGEQITDLNSQITSLTNQIAGLNKQITATQASLDKANKDYALLENRFRQDVAERVVMERRFNNLLELRAQIEDIKENPPEQISSENIYKDLDVEVSSNGSFHVLAPE